jgi:WD40 repeat protein
VIIGLALFAAVRFGSPGPGPLSTPAPSVSAVTAVATPVLTPNPTAPITVATPSVAPVLPDTPAPAFESGKLLAIFQGHTNWVFSAVFSPDSRRVLTASADQTARLWEAPH